MLGFTIGVNVLEGNKRRKRKIEERRINVKCRRERFLQVCHTHRTWGTCTIFPQCTSLLLFKLVHASCSLRWIKRSKLGSRLVSANLVAPACWAKRWLAMAPGKSVLACGRTLLVWKWLPVATLPHYHTATLPRCQGRPRWGRPPRSVLGSRQLLLTLGHRTKVLQAGDLADGIWSSCFPPRSRSFRSL